MILYQVPSHYQINIELILSLYDSESMTCTYVRIYMLIRPSDMCDAYFVYGRVVMNIIVYCCYDYHVLCMIYIAFLSEKVACKY
jgi:hypothetical protein